MRYARALLLMVLIPSVLHAQDVKGYRWTILLNMYSDKTCGKDFPKSACEQRSQAGEHDQAITACNQLITAKPKCGAAYRNRGRAELNKGKLAAAIADESQAISLEPSFVMAYVDRGIAYRQKGSHDEELKDLDKAVALDPKCAEAHNERGVTLAERQQNEMALREFDLAIKEVPNNFFYVLNRGSMLARLKRTEQALQEFQRIVNSNSGDWRLYNDLGGALYSLRYYQDAINSFLKANSLSEQPGNYASLGVSYLDTNQFEPALKAFQRASEIAPPEQLEYLNTRIWEVAYFSGRHAEALQLAVQGFHRATDPNEKELWRHHMGFSHLALGNHQSATDALQQYKTLGIRYSETDGGLKVERVLKNGPADLTGLLAGDILLEFNGSPLAGAYWSFNTDIVTKADFGAKARIRLLRNGTPVEKQVVVGVPPNLPESAGAPRSAAPGTSVAQEPAAGLSLLITNMEITPRTVPPGSPFSLSVTLTVTEPGMSEAHVTATCAIARNGETLFEGNPNLVTVPCGQPWIITKDLTAGNERGSYTIRFTLRYKSQVAEKSMEFRIE